MTRDRSDRIPLAADKARCEPAKPGPTAHRCARYMAAVPKYGGTLNDYSLDPGNPGCSALCAGYIDLAGLRRDAITAAPPRKFPPIGGA